MGQGNGVQEHGEGLQQARNKRATDTRRGVRLLGPYTSLALCSPSNSATPAAATSTRPQNSPR